MKTIGLIGGMSWESTAEYYRIMNETANERCGGLHSASCILYSFDFEEIASRQRDGDWEMLTSMMTDAARRLENAGADVVLICTNTMHLMADEVQDAIEIPLLHIVDVTGKAVADKGLSKVGLLGTRFTMEEDFYTGRLRDKYGLEVLIPPEDDRQAVHDIIFDELCSGIVKPESKETFARIMDDLHAVGAEGIILGCTEIPLLVSQEDAVCPLFDTTEIHARAAVDFALE